MKKKLIKQAFYLIMLMNCILLLGIDVHGQSANMGQSNTEFLDFSCGPRIKIVDANFSKTEYANIATWEDILDVNANGLLENFNTDFNQIDQDRFYIEIKAPGEEGNTITAKLESLKPESQAINDEINDMVLNRIDNTSKWFRSDAIMIVMDEDEVDDNFDTQDDGNSEWDANDDVGSDPTIYGEIGGEIKVTFGANEKRVAICPMGAIKTVNLNVYIATNDAGIPYVSPDLILQQLEVAKSVYYQSCINLSVNVMEQFTPTINLINGLNAGNLLVESPDVRMLINQVKNINDTKKIDLIFVNKINTTGFDTDTNGFSLNDSYTLAPDWNVNHTRTCIISGVNLGNRPFLIAHEVGHVLTNHGHYIAEKCDDNGNILVDGYNPLGDHVNERHFNVMKGCGTATDNTLLGSKRFWSFQIDWLRTATDIPQ